MRIRWYHIMVYSLFRRVWNPLFAANPRLCALFAEHVGNYHEVNVLAKRSPRQ